MSLISTRRVDYLGRPIGAEVRPRRRITQVLLLVAVLSLSALFAFGVLGWRWVG